MGYLVPSGYHNSLYSAKLKQCAMAANALPPLHPVPSNCPRRERELTTLLQRHPRKWQGGLTVLCEKQRERERERERWLCHVTIMWLSLDCDVSCDCPHLPLQMDASFEEGIRAVTLGTWRLTFLMCFECALIKQCMRDDRYFYWVCIISATLFQIQHHCLCACVCTYVQFGHYYVFHAVHAQYMCSHTSWPCRWMVAWRAVHMDGCHTAVIKHVNKSTYRSSPPYWCII